LLRAKETELGIGVGGYALLGTVLAARMLAIHAVMHEADVFPGLANRLIGRLSERIFVGWDQASSLFPASKTIVTGNPGRPEYSEAELVIAAAGALTLAELAMFALPSLLVPLDTAARGHQIANVKVYAERAGGTWVPEPSWNTESLAVQIALTLSGSDALSAQAGASGRWRVRMRPANQSRSVKLCWPAIKRLHSSTLTVFRRSENQLHKVKT
jgi:UDP-N-acetylglucosamine:LPS N-acetylglucosamine transferase